MFYEPLAISLNGVGKEYQIYQKPIDRLRAMLPWNKDKTIGTKFHALKDISIDIQKGEVVGVIGRNGAGKSTLLQIVAQTIIPSHGSATINGKVAALLELGSGFNPEFTGRENVFMSAAIAGMSQSEINSRYQSIVDFSEIGDFIDQPVKTYSSGMLVRLAFSVATSIKPDILIIDEALSVGDGAFARKSFERIIQLKDEGCTILFCSHSMYQIEMICNKALWLDHGEIKEYGSPLAAIKSYETHLLSKKSEEEQAQQTEIITTQKLAYFTKQQIFLDNNETSLKVSASGKSCETTLCIEAEWISDPSVPLPSFAATIHAKDGRLIGSAGSHIDGIVFDRDESGKSHGKICFPNIPLLKGEYEIELYLLCEKGIFFYDQRVPAARFSITQDESNVEQGLVHFPRVWQ